MARNEQRSIINISVRQVSREVRKLASQSNTYSEQISDLIQVVTHLIHEVSGAITQTNEAVKTTSGHSAEVRSSLQGITEGIYLNTESIKNITEKMGS